VINCDKTPSERATRVTFVTPLSFSIRVILKLFWIENVFLMAEEEGFEPPRPSRA
jgi:hypothetical protein